MARPKKSKKASKAPPAKTRKKNPKPPSSGGAVAPRGKERFPIVGIGASAGGLEAFQAFFSRMPDDSGLGFVLVPHLDTRHKSALVELLQRLTPMRVVEAADGMPVEPDRIHIIPPNATLTIREGRLRVQTPREPGMTIDAFMRSLAEDQKDCAVSVILSGGGSDGTLGVKAVKEQGGLTLAQASDGLRHDSMPHSAVATGLIDIVAPVEEMPAKLVAYASHLRRLQRSKGEEGFRNEIRLHLVKIFTLLRAKTGHDFSRYKDSTVIRRVQRRMQVTQVNTATAYVELLRKDAREIDLLFQDLLIGVTHFYRDEKAFAVLEKDVIPKILSAKGGDDQVRVWVPGCATGEEAYSIAILVRERLAQMDIATKVQIFATDIDAEALEFARNGRYPDSISRDVSAERLERFFVRDGTSYRVIKDIREMCIFSVHNLIKDAPFSKLDLISCRNLLIYLDASLQSRVIPLFHFALRHGGYLFLGSSENISQYARLFTKVDARLRLFRARPVQAARPGVEFPLGIASYRNHQTLEKPGPAPAAPVDDTLARRALRIVDAHSPAYVVVDDRYEAIHFSGRTGRYLQPSPGAANLNLFNILDPSLRSDVRMTLHRTASSGEPTTQESIFHKVNGHTRVLNITVEPLPVREGSRHYVVIFQDLGVAKPREPGEPQPRPSTARDEAVAHLESELMATRERLQATIEELETSNEEMKASNEEFQSVNEELQSSNEELETSKEELQSVNEELETVNAELNSKVESLERANNDRKNLLESTQIATMFLDNNLRIKSFTPAITDIFHLIETDTGRPITDIVTRLAYDALERDVRKVIRTLTRIEQEIALADGSAIYMMRILPYRTADNLIDGVVITFIDITERKRAEEDRGRLAAIVQTSHDAIIGLTAEGVITSWNQGAERIYGYTADEAAGQPLSILLPPDRANEMRSIVDRLKRARSASPIETTRQTKDGRTIHVASTVSPLRSAADKLIAASAIERDITESKRAETRQKTMVAELNHRVKNTLAAVISISTSTLQNSSTLDAFRPAFEGRIHALAKAHDLLSASGWTGADMGELAAAELAPYGNGGKGIRITGEKFTLSAGGALNFALVLHELATNAAKYGALTSEAGRVEVSWSGGGTGPFVLEWVESDGPSVKEPQRLGFGLRLIERSMKHDLQGKVDITFPREGLRCRIEVPRDEIRASASGSKPE